jgi:hypothetical protein
MLAILARVKSRSEAIRPCTRPNRYTEGERAGSRDRAALDLAGLRGLELEVVQEARVYMPFVADLMENRIFRQRYERSLAEVGLKVS